jgi:hypothetical protein
MADPNEIIAYQIHEAQSKMLLLAAPVERTWMDEASVRFPYRCLPLNIANQNGWMLTCPTSFRAYWYGGPAPEDVEIRFDGEPDNGVLAHFGVGTITFSVPFLFRTPPGMNLWVKGPSNWIKDGIQPLEGVVETDWPASTFTMNWKITRPNEWITFEQGEPVCMLVPIPRGLAESLVPKIELLQNNPELNAQYQVWQHGRSTFLQGLKEKHPEAVQRGWQKDYFQGKGSPAEATQGHQTRLHLKEFVRHTATQ